MSCFNSTLRCCFTAVTLWLIGAGVGLAQGVGGISGTVTDSSDAILPGVLVTLVNDQGAIGGRQETVTDDRGHYEFLRLVPGTYSVQAELQGFRLVRQPGVIVTSNLTARADIKLEVGSVEEAIVVTGASPLLDTTTASKQTALTREDLEALPNRTDVWSIARVIPGVVIGKIDVGGTELFESSTAFVRGSGTENKFMMDGMDVSSVSGTGIIANMYIDPYAFEETIFAAGGGSAENANGGLNFNTATRSGTNTFRGGAKFNGTTPALSRSRNYSPELRLQLLANVPAKVLQANPDIQPNADVRLLTDAGAWLGGPIKRDTLWFVTSWHDQRLDRYRLGSYDPDGTPVLDDNVLRNMTGKLSWQMSSTAQLSYFNDSQYKLIGHRGGGTFADSRARNYSYKYPTVNQVKFTKPVRSDLAVDVIYSRMRTDDTFVPRSEVRVGDIATNDTTTQVSGVALPTYSDNWMGRDQMRGSVIWSKAAHDLKLGYEFIRSIRYTRIWSLSGLRANFANGVPTSVNTYVVPVTKINTRGIPDDVPILYTFRENATGAFIQDKWQPLRKLVVNAGIRFETSRSWQPATCMPETQFFGGTCFEKITAPAFFNMSPRFNAVYDINGDGRTALKFTANRYTQPLSISVVERLNPVTTPNDQRQWLAQSQCGNTGVLGCDRNGDLIPQLSELGPSPGYVFTGVNASYQDDLQRPISNDFSVEFQRELPQGIVVSVDYAYRQTRRNIGQRNAAVPVSSWGDPITVTEVTSGEVVNVWNRPSTASALFYYNSTDIDTNYRGGDLTVSKRMSHHWSMQGGASFGKVTTRTAGGNRADPNVINSPFDGNVRSEGDRPWSVRMSGVFELPADFVASGTWQYQAGPAETTTVLVTDATRALSQGNQTVVVRRVGDVRYPNTAELDLNLRKSFKVGGRRTLTPRLELFNVTNQSTITAWVTQLGPSYHRPSGLQRGRLVKMEMAFDF